MRFIYEHHNRNQGSNLNQKQGTNPRMVHEQEVLMITNRRHIHKHEKTDPLPNYQPSLQQSPRRSELSKHKSLPNQVPTLQHKPRSSPSIFISPTTSHPHTHDSNQIIIVESSPHHSNQVNHTNMNNSANHIHTNSRVYNGNGHSHSRKNTNNQLLPSIPNHNQILLDPPSAVSSQTQTIIFGNNDHS